VTVDDLVDKAGAVRAGEELNLDALRQHLEPILGEKVSNLAVKQFPGGHSNLTYLLSSGAEQWVLRRPPFGSTVKSAHDMSREFRSSRPYKTFTPMDPGRFISVMTTTLLAATFT